MNLVKFDSTKREHPHGDEWIFDGLEWNCLGHSDSRRTNVASHRAQGWDEQFGDSSGHVLLRERAGAGGAGDGVNSSSAGMPPGGVDLPPEEGGPEGPGGPPEYDANGNLKRYNGWAYTYDAQNRLRTAHENGVLIATYYYDGKNRQIARNLNSEIRFSVWDGWELIEEYGSDRAVAYLQGATGMIKSWTYNSVIYYYQDKLGSTTHVANASGQLLESFHYDLYGKPTETSAYGVVDLYAGERWIGALGLYDLRNRFMSPELGRFLQADPIGFKGDASNLYRYGNNNPANRIDPMGLVDRDAPGRYSTLNCFGGGDWIKDSNGMSAFDFNQRGIDKSGIDPSEFRWSDGGNLNKREPVVTKGGREYTALTEPQFKMTRAEDGALIGHYIVDVRYSDQVGKNNKELQKKEPDHKREIDRDFRYSRGPEIMARLLRSGGPLEGKAPDTALWMAEQQMKTALKSAADASRDRHDYYDPLTGRHGDHVIVHPDGIKY
ncbi:MAG TPA: RHS repeat-associated core domain-containing protein [Chthoniobacterales bacterium]|nr:RHS repeat-associated core domain-containing protein [Chthoniobacterales bacterium]